MKTALIVGVTGQDGSYLASHLLGLGYRVVGTSRDAENAPFRNHLALGIAGRVDLVSMNPTDFRSVIQTIMRNPCDEIYNLSGQSSVGLSFEQPVETLESIGLATLNILEAIRLNAPQVRFYNACSSECFGNVPEGRVAEDGRFRPRSPYAVAKSQAYWQIDIYREAYSLFACSGILFNHESPLRPQRFVTRKVAAAAVRIAGGSGERLRLGNMDIRRDWGWAPEYVVAMHAILQRPTPRDYVIATGQEASLTDFVSAIFAAAGLDWRDHVDTDPALLRPSELMRTVGDPSRARSELGWQPRMLWPDVARALVEAERQKA
jgi:GDPmannose 4,6-dehydratase